MTVSGGIDCERAAEHPRSLDTINYAAAEQMDGLRLSAVASQPVETPARASRHLDDTWGLDASELLTKESGV